MFDAEEYTISIRKEVIEGETYYVSRVKEFPGLSEFCETAEEARSLTIDALTGLKKMSDSKGTSFPEPAHIEEDFSGRITLRLPKTLHRKLSESAEDEGISLNQYIVSLISSQSGKNEVENQIRELVFATKKPSQSSNIAWPERRKIRLE